MHLSRNTKILLPWHFCHRTAKRIENCTVCHLSTNFNPQKEIRINSELGNIHVPLLHPKKSEPFDDMQVE